MYDTNLNISYHKNIRLTFYELITIKVSYMLQLKKTFRDSFERIVLLDIYLKLTEGFKFLHLINLKKLSEILRNLNKEQPCFTRSL